MGLQTTGTTVRNAAGVATQTLAVTAGDLIIVDASINNSFAAPVQGDLADGVNTWHLDAVSAGSQNAYAAIWSAIAATTATLTITINEASSFGTATIDFNSFSWRGQMASPLDVTKTATGVSTAPDSGSSSSTAQASELVVGAMAYSNMTETVTVPAVTGYTNFMLNQLAFGGAGDYKEVAAAGAQSAAWTLSNSIGWAVALASYKLATVIADIPALDDSADCAALIELF